ncbi:hypothetical protein J132_09065, partial [Termitomyces sp. J132]
VDKIVEHYLLHCSPFEREHCVLARAVDLGTEALSKLLSNAKSTKALFQYINSTRCFKRTHRDLSIIEAMMIKEQGRKEEKKAKKQNKGTGRR